MNIKITFKTPQKFTQDGLLTQGMFIFCDYIEFVSASVKVYSGNDLNFFLVSDVLKIEIA